MKKVLLTIFSGVSVLVVAELVSRYWLGLGDPPLVIGDPGVDYIFATNQNCNRFGNRIIYNDASMRCDFDVLTGGGGGKEYLL